MHLNKQKPLAQIFLLFSQDALEVLQKHNSRAGIVFSSVKVSQATNYCIKIQYHLKKEVKILNQVWEGVKFTIRRGLLSMKWKVILPLRMEWFYCVTKRENHLKTQHDMNKWSTVGMYNIFNFSFNISPFPLAQIFMLSSEALNQLLCCFKFSLHLVSSQKA